MILETVEFSSPLGSLKAAIHAHHVYALGFADYWPRLAALLRARLGDVAFKEAPGHRPIVAGINDYFAGNVAALRTVPMRLVGTPFQRKVWTALQRIPAGQTLSYGALAREIDAPGAARGVGSACNANAVWLAVPCHRVVGADGGLTGYAGGIERKRWLLAHERAQPEHRRVVV
jgi:methylated-DNA-[protein]-cysteine S-methyltransferase